MVKPVSLTAMTIVCVGVQTAPRISPAPYWSRAGGVGTIPSVPIAQCSVTGGVAIVVLDPIRGTTLGTIGDRPAEVDLWGGRGMCKGCGWWY